MTATPITLQQALTPAAGERITALFARLGEGIREAGRLAADAVRTFVAAARRWRAELHERAVARANGVVRVAGLEGRYHVRAGQDPAYRDEPRIGQLVHAILSGQDRDTRLLSPTNRARVAASALRGWTMSYGPVAPETLVWHRLIGNTHVQVGRA